MNTNSRQQSPNAQLEFCGVTLTGIGLMGMGALLLMSLTGCEPIRVSATVEGTVAQVEEQQQSGGQSQVEEQPQVEEGRVILLTLAKAKIDDSQQMRARAEEAANLVENSARTFFSRVAAPQVISVREKPMASLSLTNSMQQALITRSKFAATLSDLAARVREQDTVMIYTHSHGSKTGLILNNYTNASGQKVADIMPWDEFGDLLLSIRAKNVIVFTMSCYSGGLISYLNRIEASWSGRPRAGRNFLVITAQNAESLSGPNQIQDGQQLRVMNGLPFAVYKAFGEADGYAGGRRDGALSFDEIAKYVHAVSRSAGSNARYLNDSQILKAYEPNASISQ